MRKQYYLIVFLCLRFLIDHQLASAQSNVYARLSGTPMNTAGWNLTGQAQVGDTNGDTEVGTNNELILTTPILFTSGGAFFQRPLNLAECQRWIAEFEFRMWEGTAADGMAFCFLANPPTNFVAGGGVGIPPRPRGLMIVLDTWLNCPGTTAVPKVEIRYEEGLRDYSECPNPAQPTSNTLPLRSSLYQKCRIVYENGNISVEINGMVVVTGNYRVNFPGYFGFTAATGGATDRHSIKNFVMFTDRVVSSPAVAGPDLTACSGQVVQLGVPPVPGERYAYSWSPATGLDNPNIANPRLRVPANNGTQPFRLSYFVTKDTVDAPGANLCGRVDEVVVNVPARGDNAGPDVTVCGGLRYQNTTFRGLEGYRYQWAALGTAPLSILSSTAVASPIFTLPTTGFPPQTFRYVQIATHIASNCEARDTLDIAFVPPPPPGIKTFRLCSGERQALGYPTLPGFTSTWLPAEGLSTANVSNPVFTGLAVTDADSVQRRYVLTAVSPSCTFRDTVVITVLRAVLASAGPDLRLCGDSTARLGVAPVAGLTYLWSPTTGLSDPRIANPTFRVANPTQPQSFTLILTVNNALARCVRRDTVLVSVAPNNLPRTGRRTFRLCTGQRRQIGVNTGFGIAFTWSNADNINPASPTPIFTAPAIRGDSVVFRYIQTLTNGACVARDTSDITVYRLPQANVGPDLVLCSGQSQTLGFAPERGVEYLWTPATGLSNPRASNPTVLLTNNTILPNVLRYVLSARNPATGCASVDTIQVTVQRNPFFRAIRGRIRVCSGQAQQIGPIPAAGFRYTWTPSENLSSPTIANPIFRGNNTTADSLELQYIVTVSDSLGPNGRPGCVFRDTTTIVLYRLVTANAGPDRALCSNDTSRIGQAPIRGISYAWTALGTSPLAALSATNMANPVFRLRNTTDVAIVASYVLTARNPFGCTARDTIQIRVVAGELPAVGRRTVRLCAGETRAIGQTANPLFRYRWSPSANLSSDTLASPTVRGANVTTDSVTTRYVLTISNGACQVRDTTDVVVYRLPVANAGPDRSVCSGETVGVGAEPQPGLTYQWLALPGASLTNLTATNVANPRFSLPNLTGANVLNSYVLRVRNAAGCLTADTLVITVTPRVETSGLEIQGPVIICANNLAAYTLNRVSGNRYQWEIQGGQITSGQGTPNLRVAWGSGPTGQLTLTETTATGCTGTPIILAVTISPLPRPRLERADSVVCRSDRRGKIYRATGLTGSRFGWIINGGRISSATADSAQITVDWDTLTFPKRLALTERSAAGCASAAALTVRVELDGTAISLRAVGVQLSDERNTEVRFRIVNAPSLAQVFTVERRIARSGGSFQAAGTVQAADTVFVDRNLDTDANSYEYRIRRTQQTGTCPTAEAAPHTTIRLQGNATPQTENVALNWSAYEGWRNVARYEVWRRADGGTNTLVTSTSGTVLNTTILASRAGFVQCFRLRAIEAGTGRESWSNEICVGFEFPLVVPNVITPNGDGRNDRFAIPNLELYQQPILEVFNRYGQKIYESAGYRNDWDGNNYPTGTYFYLLRTRRPGQENLLEFKGWVQVLR